MRRIGTILSMLVLSCMAFASSNGGVRHLQPVRVPVILTNYADIKFQDTDYAAYKSQLEQYFADNSYGKYTPVFDFLGPVTIAGNRSDYGANDSDGDDQAAAVMVADACNAAEDLADFTKYDQNGDGRLDAVVIIYAGEGEHADNNMLDAVWEFTDDLETTYELDYLVQLDGKTVAACCAVPELSIKNKRDGIGTLVHEFAHILGLPNLCTTNGGVQKTLGDWDVMDHGSYNDHSHTPAAMSAYERFYLGWVEPILLDEAMNVRLGDLNTTGDCAIITASGQSNLNGLSPDPREFYILENRQQAGWDKNIPGHGLMLTKIDFVKNKWESDEVNNVEKRPCVDLIEADGKCPTYKADNLTNGYFGKQGDLFPAGANEYTMFSGKMYFSNVREEGGVIYLDFLGGVERCTVSFSVSNGMSASASLTESKKGAGIILPSVTPNNGYTFLGWATRKNSNVPDAGQQGDTYYPMSDCSLFAVMQDNTRHWVNYDLKGVTIGDYIGFNGAYVKANDLKDIAVTFIRKEGYQTPTADNCLVKVVCGGKQLTNAVRYEDDIITVSIPAEAITGDIFITIVNVREQKENGCDAYSHTFTSIVRAGAAQEFGAYNWDVTIANDNTVDFDSKKGAVFGSGSYPAGLVRFYTEETMGCAPAVIRVQAAANGDGVLSVYVAGNRVGEAVELSTTLEEYFFEAENPTSGALEIRLENTQKAMYIRKIDVDFVKWEPDEEENEQTAVEPMTDERQIAPAATKIIRNGQLFILQNGRIVSILGTTIQ